MSAIGRMDLPPGYAYDGEIPEGAWAVVYRDESEPSLPEYVCVVFRCERNALGKSVRTVIGGLSSFISSDATSDRAVDTARHRIQKLAGAYPPMDLGVVFWGVVRSA